MTSGHLAAFLKSLTGSRVINGPLQLLGLAEPCSPCSCAISQPHPSLIPGEKGALAGGPWARGPRPLCQAFGPERLHQVSLLSHVSVPWSVTGGLRVLIGVCYYAWNLKIRSRVHCSSFEEGAAGALATLTYLAAEGRSCLGLAVRDTCVVPPWCCARMSRVPKISMYEYSTGRRLAYSSIEYR